MIGSRIKRGQIKGLLLLVSLQIKSRFKHAKTLEMQLTTSELLAEQARSCEDAVNVRSSTRFASLTDAVNERIVRLRSPERGRSPTRRLAPS